MAYNFPNSPAVNDIFQDYKWDGEKWILTFGGIPSVWTPLNLTGLRGWWDARVLASITKDGSNHISAVIDQSGNGLNVSAFGLFGATYSVTGFNGLPAFDSNSGGLQCSLPMGTGTELTAFFVGRFSTGSGFNGRALSYMASGQTHDYDNNGSWYLARDNGTSNLAVGRNGTSASAAAGYNTNLRVIATINSSGVMVIYINGVATTGGTLNAAWGTPGTLVLGRINAPLNDDWLNVLGEVGICNQFTNSTTVALLDTYLKNKWGL